MPHYMRYVTREDSRLSLETLQRGLSHQDDAYRCFIEENEKGPYARLEVDGMKLAVVRIERPDQREFHTHLSQLKRALPKTQKQEADLVVELLSEARAIIAVGVYFGEREAIEIMDMLDPIWEFMFHHWDGLLADDDGFHDPFGLVLKVA